MRPTESEALPQRGFSPSRERQALTSTEGHARDTQGQQHGDGDLQVLPGSQIVTRPHRTCHTHKQIQRQTRTLKGGSFAVVLFSGHSDVVFSRGSDIINWSWK